MPEEEERLSDFDPRIEANVETLEARAREFEKQEIERSRSIDQKTAALMAACLVVLGAAVAFAGRISDLGGGDGARTLWAVLLIAAMMFVVVALGFATSAIRPQTIATGIHIDELEQWPYEEKLASDPVAVRGELMAASIDAVREARAANRLKGRRLLTAFALFAAALVATLALGVSVAVRQAGSSPTMTEKTPPKPVEQPPTPKESATTPKPLFRTPKRDHTLRESEYKDNDKP
jgi:MFS family permease